LCPLLAAIDAAVLPFGSCELGSVTAPADAPAAISEATIFSLPWNKIVQ
jgi:hypothetical protein